MVVPSPTPSLSLRGLERPPSLRKGKRMKLLTVVLATLILVGCGGNPPQPAQPAQTAQVSGIWTGKLTSAVTGDRVGASLNLSQAAGATVTGVGIASTPNTCFNALKTTQGAVVGHDFNAPFTADFGGVITVNTDVILDSSGTAIKLQGTYHALGGPCDGDFGNLLLTR